MAKIDPTFQNQFVKSIVLNEKSSNTLDNIIPVGKLNIDQVINVYHNDYYSRLTEALCETFEAVWAVVGDDDFFSLCREYIYVNPSFYRELGEIGVNMPSFLCCHKLSSDYPFLKELSLFELSFWNTFHSEREYLSLDLSNSGESQLLTSRFKFVSNLKLFTWEYKIFDIWEMRKKGFEECEDDFSISQSVAIFKSKKNVEAIRLSLSQYKIITLLQENLSFNEALTKVEISKDEIQSLFFNLNNHNLLTLD